MDPAERRLVENASQGDALAIDRLLERHLATVEAFVRVKARGAALQKESVSDLVQSVCREVLEDLSGFEYRGEAAFRSWLLTRAMHKIVDRNRYYRREKRDVAREVPAGPPSGDRATRLLDVYGSFCTPSREAVAHEEIARIERALERLPDDQREVIALSRIAGLPTGEIAARLGKTDAAVRGLLARGLARLSTLLRV